LLPIFPKLCHLFNLIFSDQNEALQERVDDGEDLVFSLITHNQICVCWVLHLMSATEGGLTQHHCAHIASLALQKLQGKLQGRPNLKVVG
jgi:hypothetical protein